MVVRIEIPDVSMKPINRSLYLFCVIFKQKLVDIFCLISQIGFNLKQVLLASFIFAEFHIRIL